jgi:L-malate glycosyltransferase
MTITGETTWQITHRAVHGAPTPAVSAPVRPVRVCYLIDELTTAGTETQLLALIRRLDRRRVTPFLCVLRGEDARSQALEPSSDICPVLRLGVRSLRHPSSIIKACRFASSLRRESIDVLQVYFPDSTYFAIPAALLTRVPHVVRTRNNLGYWMTPWHRRLGRFCNWFTEVLIANCDASRESVIADEGMPPERVIVLENGVDLDRFPVVERPRAAACRRVGVVANLRHVKGLDVFIRAAELVAPAHPDATFHIAGEGPLRADLEGMVNAHGLGIGLVFEGSIVDVPAFLAGLDVAVLPSRSEGMSNALLEYMAAGKAVVATAVGGNTRLIDDGIHGLLVRPDDPAALAGAMHRLLHDDELARRLGQAARRRVEQRYSREAMVRRFEDFYVQLLGV